MIQEDINNRSVALSIKASKMTGQVLAKALLAALRKMQKGGGPKHGKQTVKQLAKHYAGLTNIEINDGNIKSFERVARKYGVDFALKQDRDTPPKWLVFFKARDADALTAAFNEFSRETLRRERKPSVLETVRGFMERTKNAVLERPPKQRERGGRTGPDR